MRFVYLRTIVFCMQSFTKDGVSICFIIIFKSNGRVGV